MYKVYALKEKTGKVVYVGYTSRSLHDRWRHHKNTYPERVKLEIALIVETPDKNEAKFFELRFQREFNTIYPNGLNIAVGHTNNDGKKLLKDGFKTRFGNRRKYPGEEAKRVKNHAEGIKRLRKCIRCINDNRVYESLAMAANKLGIDKSAICMQLKGKRKHAGGYRFEYVPSINSL